MLFGTCSVLCQMQSRHLCKMYSSPQTLSTVSKPCINYHNVLPYNSSVLGIQCFATGCLQHFVSSVLVECRLAFRQQEEQAVWWKTGGGAEQVAEKRQQFTAVKRQHSRAAQCSREQTGGRAGSREETAVHCSANSSRK